MTPCIRIRALLPAFGMACLLAWSASPVRAARAGASAATEVRKSVEMRMRVTGHVDVAADGSVSGYTLDEPGKLPPIVKQNVAKNVPGWRFAPLDDAAGPRSSRLPMRLSMRATPRGDGNYTLRIVAADIGSEPTDPDERLEQAHLARPAFPREAYASGYSGIAYVLLKIGVDGRVEQAGAEQVNMWVYGTAGQMEHARALFARSAVDAARRWRFKVPTKGPMAGKPYWMARVPVAYSLMGDRRPAYGEWEPYVPGPRSRFDWVDRKLAAGSPEALGNGGVYALGSGTRLLTTLDEG